MIGRLYKALIFFRLKGLSIAQESIMKECLIKGQQKSFDVEWWRSNPGMECQSDVMVMAC